MTIYLVQHGKSLSKDVDPEQSLSDQGQRETEWMADLAKEKGLKVDKIQHSSKKRAKETAEFFSSRLEPAQGVEEKDGIKAMDDPKALLEELDSGSNLMLVGHLPFLERLAALLVVDRTEPRVVKFQNSGIVGLDQEEKNWYLKFMLLPWVDH